MKEFTLPPRIHNDQGEVRMVGVELEFSGLSLPDAAEAIHRAIGGELRQDHEYRYTLQSEFGEYEITFDSSLLSNKKYEEKLDKLGLPLPHGVKGLVEGVLKKLGNSMLPLEVGTPPIPITRLDEVSRLECALRDAHAKGTRAGGPLAAFALHFNPSGVEPHSAEYLGRVTRCFLLLYHWLFRKAEVNWTRRVMPFIDPFPEKYARLVIAPDYAPDMAGFVHDYVQHNPTRNRPLDLLPILAFNDRELTNRPPLVGHKVRPRPTFHYRLPNSLIDDPNWSVAQEWEQWVLIERLAEQPEMVEKLTDAYLHWDGGIAGYLGDKWFKFVDTECVPQLQAEAQLAGGAA